MPPIGSPSPLECIDVIEESYSRHVRGQRLGFALGTSAHMSYASVVKAGR